MRILLTGGFYQSKSIIANAQRCINLYPEKNPEDSPVPITTYLTPGLTLLGTAPNNMPNRCTYRTSQGQLYTVNGDTIYAVSSSWVYTSIGTITNLSTPVSMADNGLVILVVDGTPDGWAIDIATNAFGVINDSAFYGSPRVDYVDTYFLLSQPGTNAWYISLSNATFAMLTSIGGSITSGTTVGGTGYTDGTYTAVPLTGGTGSGATGTFTIAGGIVGTVTIVSAGIDYVIGDTLSASDIGAGAGFVFEVVTIGGAFDPLAIATKNGYPDPIAALIVMHREVWLIGQLTSEVWYDAGNADFAFSEFPGAFIEHGCVAPYSVAKQDLSVYWLSQDEQGQTIVIRGASYQATRISTHAMENEISKYSVISDAIGCTYQQEGHVFYLLFFPTANKTWCWDQTAELWHERAWTDDNGILNRHRANCVANVYDVNVAGDWQNGNLYAFDEENFTDNGQPISRIRSFPHFQEDRKRITHKFFYLDMDVGEDDGSVDGSTPSNPPMISLRWSDTKGASWGNAVEQSLGAGGQYLTNIQYSRLGMARDRVYEVSWSCPALTALQSAWIEPGLAAT